MEKELISGHPVSREPILLDTTLRDGEQSPGLYFTRDEKVFVARELDSLGVRLIEAGIPGMGPEEREDVRTLVKLNLKATIIPWNRLTVGDVEASLACGVAQVHVSVPTSRQMLSQKMNRSQAWVLEQMEEVVRFAIDRGVEVSLGAEDASRTDLRFLSEVLRLGQDLGVCRVRFADTLGMLTPDQTSLAIGTLTKDLRIPLDYHGHNDFGLATANTLAAWKAGARVVSCTLLGLGERAGNTSLEEFVGAAHFLGGQFSSFPFLRLHKVCTTLAFLTGRPMDPHKPLFGAKVFHHESGIHVDGLLKAGETYELFPPEKVGGRRSLVVGKHSGRAAVKHLASLQGVTLGDTEAQDFLDGMRARMATERGIDEDALFQNYLMNHCSSPFALEKQHSQGDH